MDTEPLLKLLQPVLIGIGLMVVLNLWNIIQSIIVARKSKDLKMEKSLEAINVKLIGLEYEMQQNKKDLNNLGQMIKEFKK